MRPDLNISYFKPDRPGVYIRPDGSCAFCFDAGMYFGKARKLGVVLYDKNGRETRIPFKSSARTGALYALSVSDLDFTEFTYNFYVDDSIINDPYGKAFTRSDSFGVPNEKPVRGIITKSFFDWGDDVRPDIPYENSIMYGLNVRAFTMHPTSKVKNRGTFEGIKAKLDYLKGLGVTTLVLMPAYEFDECLAMKRSSKPQNLDEMAKSKTDAKVNCWGFQEAYYFAPKAHYCASNDPTESIKDLVKSAHPPFLFPARIQSECHNGCTAFLDRRISC